MSKPRVAFLGLGIMGSGMAGQLLKHGFPLTVYNRNAAKADGLKGGGATVATSPREAAENADVIVSMLADDNAARAVWLGDAGVLSGVPRGAILIESSTVTLDWVKALDAAAKARGCELIDAPVTGSKAAAAAGELNFIVGGSESTLGRARPVLEAMGKTITHLGPTGSGAMVKLINNFVCGAQLASLAEGMAFLERSGIDREKALPIMSNGAPGSPLFKALSGRMTARDYTPNFLLRLLAKDMGYAIKEAGALSLELTTAQTTLALLNRAIVAGYGDVDMAAVVEPLRQTKPAQAHSDQGDSAKGE